MLHGARLSQLKKKPSVFHDYHLKFVINRSGTFWGLCWRCDAFECSKRLQALACFRMGEGRMLNVCLCVCECVFVR